MKKIINFITRRQVVVGILILAQLFLIFAVIYRFSINAVWVSYLLGAISVILIIHVANQNKNPSYKLVWCVLILATPVIGGVLYLLFGNRKVPKQLRRSMLISIQNTMPLLNQEEKTLEKIKEKSEKAYNQFYYVWKNSYFPAYENTDVTYYNLGEKVFEAMVEELKQAEKFIFLEYFIIGLGVFWNTILEILEEKVKEGVQVRVMFDDAGCVRTLPRDYKLQLEKKGIECFVFNPLHPKLAVQLNNRDHRKIMVIDNRIAFVGGINLADEYINEIERFGHWKDTAVKLEGEAVWSFTMMFLQFWQYSKKEKDNQYLSYKIVHSAPETEGYVQPFSDTPTDDEEVGLNVHMNMINKAKKYIYIHTPYLIISYEMQKALVIAAKSGVDVRITLPHSPDKWYVHLVSQFNYRVLVEAGVKIYEYKPGFMHSKLIVSDDQIGIIGTINMDYRSYYMHYECGVLMYQHPVLKDMKRDYLLTLEECVLITEENLKKTPFLKIVLQAILNLFSPLM